MLKIIISLMMMSLSLVMYFFQHPLSLGLSILIQTLLTCIITGMMMKSYWFSYILFLTFLGGLLVLFMYVMSMAANEMFKFSMKTFTLFLISLFFILMISILFYSNLQWMNFYINSDMNLFIENYLFFNNENKFNLTKLYNNQTFMLTMMAIIYLFITLIAIVKIMNLFYGPLRSSKIN